MGVYRTALGKQVDMTALAAKNEKVRAVGNMRVNARGDTIDDFDRVIKPVTEKVGENYARGVSNRSAQVSRRSAIQADVQRTAVKKEGKPVKEELELTEAEKELEDNLDEDLEIEAIRAKELGKK